MGFVFDERQNTVIDTLKQVFSWRSTKWWQSAKAVEIKKKRLTTHSGNVSGAGTTAGVSGTRWPLNGPVMKTGSVKERNDRHLKTKKINTFVLQSVNHSTIQRIETAKKKKGKTEDKVPRILEPADKSIHIREEGPTAQLCGDSGSTVSML